MCGIVGLITPEGYKGSVLDRKKFLRQGLLTDVVRGEDSTGVMYAAKEKGKNQLWYHKKACDPYQFVTGDIFQRILSADVANAHFVVGHNRAATIGKITEDNAHPFVEESNDGGAVILLHNGTLDDVDALPALGPKRIEVDSHEICYNLAQVAPGNAKTVLESLYGAFVLCWADSRDETLNIVRNADRPLHFLRGYGGVIYFASEALHLKWLATRLKLASTIEVFSLEPGKWLKFNYGSVKPTVRDIRLNETYWVNSRYARPYGSGYRAPSSGQNGTGRSWVPQESSPPPARQGGGNSEAGHHTAGSERIYIGGNWREFPDTLVEVLDTVGLDPKDRLLVEPWSVDKGGQSDRYVVSGWCHTLSAEVRATRVLDYMAPQIRGGCTMLARPVGVFFERGDWPVVLVEVIHTNGMQHQEHFQLQPTLHKDQREAAAEEEEEKPGKPKDTPPKSSACSTPAADDVPQESDFDAGVLDGVFTDEHGVTWYMGPHGTTLTDTEWLAATVDGCAVCTETLTIEDAEDTIWDGNYPICPHCVEAGNTDITRGWMQGGMQP